ncbi:GNAT family N-acetyltransferase [Rhodanobacter sp. AS-Z3]|uniref:GNAT family N-acetyltransferase n=1 Tax=Rhodanobacter sp. AS-Z3 TaxID=3031330 RepID=UPI0024787EFD|nr:GNAT family N-acetyltransferase [Rhodanobacter sp. AS-Z3]WEN14798.1 GNAT family N-acetyltransferase [Rhodanobacter sp. AS-Z3]
MTDSSWLLRLAEEEDDDFIIEQIPRFVNFTLPPWRRRHECIEGIRDDLLRHLEDQPPNSYLFVAEGVNGERAGFIHLQRTTDFFTGHSNCHISDIAVAPSHEGQGVGKALLAHAEAWASEHHCQLVTLAVFPGNERARALYESAGYATDLLRLAKPVR